jgi:hypothetical protein
MHQRSLKCVLFVAFLAGGLAFAGPAPVHAAPVDAPQAVWKWLARIWEAGVTVLWTPEAGRAVGIPEKAGGCIDPNGCTLNSMPPPAGLTCNAWNDAGGCIDPNG